MQKEPIATVTSVTEFIEAIKKAQPQSGFLTFRGHRRPSWKVLPAILRSAKGIIQREKEAIRDLLSIHPQEFSNDQAMFDRLVRVQHFGLPTRLLDVTANPLVALFFASETVRGPRQADGEVILLIVPQERKKYFDSDAVSCVANLVNLTPEEKLEIENNRELDIYKFNKLRSVDRLLQSIRHEKSHFRPEIIPNDLFVSNYVVSKLSNRRIVAQAGAFIIFGISNDGAKRSSLPLIQTKRILIPAAAKVAIRGELEMLGIYESTLFPEIDKAAQYVTRRYQQSATSVSP